MLPSGAVVSLGPSPSSLAAHDGKSSGGRAWELLWEMVQQGPFPSLDGLGTQVQANLTQGPKGNRRKGGGVPNSFILPIVSKPINFLVFF